MQFCLIPGKIEDWVVIIDLKGVSVTNPPTVTE